MSKRNSENDSLNQGKVLSPPKNSLIKKIDELINIQKLSFDAIQKSLKNQETMIKYIYDIIKKKEEKEEKKKKTEEEKISKQSQKQNKIILI